MNARIEYRAGAENGIHRVGETTLRVSCEGLAILEHRRMGQLEVWDGHIQAASLTYFFDLLSKSNFPTQQDWTELPPDETLRFLAVETDTRRSIVIPWHEAMKQPGYADAFRVLDEVIGQLSGGRLALARQIGDIHVTNARKRD